MAVTKEVWGKNTNVGAKKADMIAEMRAKGFVLVNEIAEPYYFEGVAGFGAGNCTKYTLTFQYSEELHKQIQKEEEERKKREAEEAAKRAEEAARRRAEEAAQRGKEKREHDSLRGKLMHGFGVLITANVKDKKTVKASIAAIKAALKSFTAAQYDLPRYYEKSWFQNFKKNCTIIKKYGKYYALLDYGKKQCDVIAGMLCAAGAKAEVVILDGENSIRKYKDLILLSSRSRFSINPNGIFDDIISYAINRMTAIRTNSSASYYDPQYIHPIYKYFMSDN